jgi:CspA family cold shock protein
MPKGTVKWFNDAKGYGFLRVDGKDEDIFVHYSAVQAEGYRTLNEGDAVTFDLIQGPKGMKAENVVRAEEVPAPNG